MTERNTALFDQIADLIEADPTRYDQETYGDGDNGLQDLVVDDKVLHCGTAHCIAGWAAVAEGYYPVINPYGPSWSVVSRTPGVDIKDRTLFQDVDLVAANLLGLDLSEAYTLFDSDWLPESIRDLEDPNYWYESDNQHFDPEADKVYRATVAKAVADELRAIGRGKEIIR